LFGANCKICGPFGYLGNSTIFMVSNNITNSINLTMNTSVVADAGFVAIAYLSIFNFSSNLGIANIVG